VDLVKRLFDTPGALFGWAVANLLGNMALIVTGGLVRLTGSGLGCPTWPRCSAESYVPHRAMGIHGAIEFGNRLLTFVLVALAIGLVVAAFRARRGGQPIRVGRVLAVLIAAGIPLQGVIGGITVLTQLNPYVVALHLLLSVLLIVLCVVLLRVAFDAEPAETKPRNVALARLTFALTMVSIVLGTLVTGSGPNAGDGSARRTGLDLELVAKIHAWSVWLLVAAAIACVVTMRTSESIAHLVVLGLQGIIGYVQYFTHLPIGLVIAHMVGVALASATGAALLLSVKPERVLSTRANLAKQKRG